ncbi:hypothetical protein HK099_005906 [Clydaea vesicula]|uniref:Uncharacterized protein n=1 Tax=Clydaea vesicula TaxID=447962 RepID=A0AAD5U327_9FUNG|nr:hypothetical protein HK099_005906 [Clydaea vesicula]
MTLKSKPKVLDLKDLDLKDTQADRRLSGESETLSQTDSAFGYEECERIGYNHDAEWYNSPSRSHSRNETFLNGNSSKMSSAKNNNEFLAQNTNNAFSKAASKLIIRNSQNDESGQNFNHDFSSAANKLIKLSNNVSTSNFVTEKRLLNTAVDFSQYKKLYQQRTILSSNWIKSKYTKSVLTGHADSVYCIQFDNKKIVSGSRDRTIKVWSMETKKCIRTLSGHTGSVLCLQYDDKYLVSGSSDSTIIQWLLDDGSKVRRLCGHATGVLDIRLSDRYIVSCSKDCSIKVWDVELGIVLHTLEGHSAAVNAIHLHNNILASASGDCLVKLWDCKTGRFLREFNGHKRGLACVQFDGETVISGSNDKQIKVWNARTGELIKNLEGHTKLVRTLCFDRHFICSGSYDESIRVFRRNSEDVPVINNGERGSEDIVLNLQNAHKSWVFHVQIDAGRIVSASQDQQIIVWDFTTGVDMIDKILEI